MRAAAIKLRALPEQRDLIDQAANLLGKDRSDFMLEAACERAVKEVGCQHIPIITGGGPESVKHEEFTWVNTMIGNVKNAVTGVYHAMLHEYRRCRTACSN